MRTRSPLSLATALLPCIALFGCDRSPTAVNDMAPPTIALSSPAITPGGYSIVSHAAVILRGTATDDVSVTRMTYSLNGAAEQAVSISAGSSVDFEFTVPALEPGSNHLMVSAFDGADNRAETQRHINYAVVRYQVVEAGRPGDGSSRPRAINASGDMAFEWQSMRDPRGAQGFVWSGGALMQLILPAGHVLMGVSGINASRVVVGDLEDVGTGAGDWRDVPVIWENGEPTVLSLLPGYTMGGASAINDAGTIAGYVMDDGWDSWAAVLWRNGEPTLIRADAAASDINASGVVAGSFWTGNSSRAFRWDNGQLIPLEPPPGMNVSEGLAINDAGDVVGFSYNRATFPHTRATLWRGTTVTSLGELPGGMYYRAWGINNHRQAVGGVDYEQPGSRTAFISENGRMSLLNHLTDSGWDIIEAMGINDAGQIVALALRAGSDPFLNGFHSVLLVPLDAAAAGASAVSVSQPSTRAGTDHPVLDGTRARSAIDRLRARRALR
jgi:probable HAF family extracellular repeat protein